MPLFDIVGKCPKTKKTLKLYISESFYIHLCYSSLSILTIPLDNSLKIMTLDSKDFTIIHFESNFPVKTLFSLELETNKATQLSNIIQNCLKSQEKLFEATIMDLNNIKVNALYLKNGVKIKGCLYFEEGLECLLFTNREKSKKIYFDDFDDFIYGKIIKAVEWDKSFTIKKRNSKNLDFICEEDPKSLLSGIQKILKRKKIFYPHYFPGFLLSFKKFQIQLRQAAYNKNLSFVEYFSLKLQSLHQNYSESPNKYRKLPEKSLKTKYLSLKAKTLRSEESPKIAQNPIKSHGRGIGLLRRSNTETNLLKIKENDKENLQDLVNYAKEKSNEDFRKTIQCIVPNKNCSIIEKSFENNHMFYKKKDMSVNDSRFLYEEEIDNLNKRYKKLLDEYVSQSQDNEKFMQKILELNMLLREKNQEIHTLKLKSSYKNKNNSDYNSLENTENKIIQELKLENQKLKFLYNDELTKRFELEKNNFQEKDLKINFKHDNYKDRAIIYQKILEENLKLKMNYLKNRNFKEKNNKSFKKIAFLMKLTNELKNQLDEIKKQQFNDLKKFEELWPHLFTIFEFQSLNLTKSEARILSIEKENKILHNHMKLIK